MGKLFNLKEWLTVADAAKHLSIVFGEDVTDADVLRLALDGRLQLSVHFVNGTQARRGEVVSWNETEWILGPAFSDRDGWATEVEPSDQVRIMDCPANLHSLYEKTPNDIKEKTTPLCMSLNIGGERYLNRGEKISTLWNVWDLPMIGGERLDIEHAYQQLTGGPAITAETIDGAFVEGSEGQICQLLEDYDNNEFQAGSTAQLVKLKRHIAGAKIKKAEAESLLKLHKEDRKKFQEERKSKPAPEHFYPAGGLPKDSVLVVRTNALREFEASINDTIEPTSADEPTPGRRGHQIETILAVIAALQYAPLKIPDGGKAKIKAACLTRHALFTESAFEHAWKHAVSDGQVRMENHDKFSPK